jgi:hypothetical protein
LLPQEAEVKAKFAPAIKEGASAEKALEAARAAAKQAVGAYTAGRQPTDKQAAN